MAKLNIVNLMGVILEDPIIKVTKDGEYVTSTLKILTARRSYQNEKQNLAGIVRSDIQQVVTRSAYLIENFILDLEVGDLVIVKGSLSTREITRKVRCPHCGEIEPTSIGVKVYVDPVTIFKVKSVNESSEEDINKMLVTFSEISNYATFFGTLVREPRYAPDYGVARREIGMQVALNRKRYIVEDGPDKRTDYPYVRAFGELAEKCSKVLHTGSEIYIEGAIETRELQLEKQCSSCRETFFVNSVAVEIVPYSIEFTEGIDLTPLRNEKYGITDDEEDDDSDNDYEDDYDEDYEDDEDDDEYSEQNDSGRKTYSESIDYDGYDEDGDN